MQETADANLNDNYWPARVIPKTFKLKKTKPGKNPMQKAQEKPEADKEKEEKKGTEEGEKPKAPEPAQTEAAG